MVMVVNLKPYGDRTEPAAIKNRVVTTKLESEIHWLLRKLARGAGLTQSEYLRLLIVRHLDEKGLLTIQIRDAMIEQPNEKTASIHDVPKMEEGDETW
jgi:hypothetical protein